MARHEQKLTEQSLLPLLARPGVLGQYTLPGLPPPRENSPISIPRLAFILRRPVSAVTLLRDRLGRHWHRVETKKQESGYTSSLSFRSDGDMKEATKVETIRGKHIKLAQDGQTAVLTNEHGATLRYDTAVPLVSAPSPVEQEIPWYLRTYEQVGQRGIRLENMEADIVDAPVGATVTKNGRAVLRFKLRLANIPETIELTADVYNDTSRDRGGNPNRIQQTQYKKLRPGERVVFTGHYHIDRTVLQAEKSVKPFERRWLRLLVVDRKPTG